MVKPKNVLNLFKPYTKKLVWKHTISRPLKGLFGQGAGLRTDLPLL